MAKFLFCLPRYHTNAVPWVRILQSAGHDVAMHAITRGATENYRILRPTILVESQLSARIRRVFADQGANDTYAFPSFRSYWRLMAQEKPDVVIIRGVTRWFSRMALLVALLQRRRVVIYDQEDPIPSTRSTWLRRAVLRAIGIPHVTARLSPGPFAGSYGRAASLPFGAPTDWKKPNVGETDTSPPKLLMVAKYRARKGHEVVLKALAQIVSDHPCALTFCGEEAGPQDRDFVHSLTELAGALGLSDHVRFQNNVPHEQMGEVYRAHDLFILPSRNEPAAVSSIEAAWNGCAVLISKCSGTRSYAPPGPEFEFDPEEVEDVARTIRFALQNRSRLQSMRDLCHDYITEVAGDDVILRKFESLLPGAKS